MKYTNTETLRQEYKDLLDNNGIKQIFVANKLEMTKQNFHRFINTKQWNFEDINQLLNAIGYELHYEFVRKTDID